MMHPIVFDEISCLSSQRLDLFKTKVWARPDFLGAREPDIEISNGATFSGQDRDTIFEMSEQAKIHVSFRHVLPVGSCSDFCQNSVS